MISAQVESVTSDVTVGVCKCGLILQEALNQCVYMHASILVMIQFLEDPGYIFRI